MNKKIIAKELLKIAKELISKNFGDYNENNRFYLSGNEMEELGRNFLKSVYYNKIEEKVNQKFSEKNYQDSSFMAKQLLNYLKSKEVQKVFKDYLKDQYKKNRKQESKNGMDGIYPNADRDLQNYYKYGSYLLYLNNLRFPTIEKIMQKYCGKDWRKYIR